MSTVIVYGFPFNCFKNCQGESYKRYILPSLVWLFQLPCIFPRNWFCESYFNSFSGEYVLASHKLKFAFLWWVTFTLTVAYWSSGYLLWIICSSLLHSVCFRPSIYIYPHIYTFLWTLFFLAVSNCGGVVWRGK